MAESSHTQWEYKLVTMGNPLEPDIELRANAVGRHGWELVTIDAGVWIFKRQTHEAPHGELQALIGETVPLVETEADPAAASTTS